MLKKLDDLPPNVVGVRAEGKVTRDDYETVLVPLLTEHRARGQRIRFVYQVGPEFTGFTAGAAADDFRIGMKYLRLFERCAVVSDVEWIRHSTHFIGTLLPCPVRVFRNDQLKDAVQWLASPEPESNLDFELGDDGVLIVRPKGSLRREDFDKIAGVLDPWIETHRLLRGLVISIPKFPGWENVGSLIRHLEFVHDHHRKILRVALSVDGAIPEVMSKVAAHFVDAEIKQFHFDEFDKAVKWARAENGSAAG